MACWSRFLQLEYSTATVVSVSEVARWAELFLTHKVALRLVRVGLSEPSSQGLSEPPQDCPSHIQTFVSHSQRWPGVPARASPAAPASASGGAWAWRGCAAEKPPLPRSGGRAVQPKRAEDSTRRRDGETWWRRVPHAGDRSLLGRFRKLTALCLARDGTYRWGGLVAGWLRCEAAVGSIITSTCFGSALWLALTSYAEDSK